MKSYSLSRRGSEDCSDVFRATSGSGLRERCSQQVDDKCSVLPPSWPLQGPCQLPALLPCGNVGTDRRWPRAVHRYWTSQLSRRPTLHPLSRVTIGANVQKGYSSGNGIVTGLRNVVWPPEVLNSSSRRTSRPGELFPNPQSCGTDRTGAAAVTT